MADTLGCLLNSDFLITANRTLILVMMRIRPAPKQRTVNGLSQSWHFSDILFQITLQLGVPIGLIKYSDFYGMLESIWKSLPESMASEKVLASLKKCTTFSNAFPTRIRVSWFVTIRKMLRKLQKHWH